MVISILKKATQFVEIQLFPNRFVLWRVATVVIKIHPRENTDAGELELP